MYFREILHGMIITGLRKIINELVCNTHKVTAVIMGVLIQNIRRKNSQALQQVKQEKVI